MANQTFLGCLCQLIQQWNAAKRQLERQLDIVPEVRDYVLSGALPTLHKAYLEASKFCASLYAMVEKLKKKQKEQESLNSEERARKLQYQQEIE